MARHCARGHCPIPLPPQLQQLNAHDLCQALQACHLCAPAPQVSFRNVFSGGIKTWENLCRAASIGAAAMPEH